MELHPYGDVLIRKNKRFISMGTEIQVTLQSLTGTKVGGLEGFKVGTDIPIYSFNALTDKITILNKKYFTNMFMGTDGRNRIFRLVNKQSKIDILSIMQRYTSNTVTGRDDYIRLTNLDSYKSTTNIVNTGKNSNTYKRKKIIVQGILPLRPLLPEQI